jgi:NADH-quinone oxidoreductase subunit G
MESLGPWDGARPPLNPVKEPKAARARAGALVVSTWKHLLDRGSMQDGDVHLAATARAAVARINPSAYDALFGMLGQGAGVTLTGDRGSVTLPVEVADLPDGVVWVPANSFGRGVLADLASPGSSVTIKGARP